MILEERCLYNLQQYSTIKKELWRDLLEIDIQDIDDNYLTKESILSFYNRQANQIKSIFDTFTNNNTKDLIEQENIYVLNLIKSFIYLKHFLQGKLEQVKKEYCYSVLNSVDIDIIGRQPQYLQETFSFMLISSNHLISLLDILHLCLANNLSYREYLLSIDFEGVTDFVLRNQLEEKLELGFTINNLNTEVVDRTLTAFEVEQDTHFRIKCRHIIEFENETILFILREDSRASIRKIDEYLVDTSAEWTVLRFSDSWKKVRIRSHLKNASEIPTNILKDLTNETNFFYVPSDKQTTLYNFTKFFVKLLAGKFENIKLLEVKTYLLSAPGVPSLIIRKESETELNDTLNNIKSNGLKILRSMHDVEYIKVEFIERDSENIYQLRSFSVSNSTTKYIQFSGRGKLSKRQRFLSLIETHNIIANEGRIE